MPEQNQTSKSTIKNTHLWDYCWVRDLIFVLVVFAILWMAYSIRSITAPILIGFGFAYVFNPFVTWVNVKLRWPRWLVTLLILLFAYVGLLSTLIYVVPQAYQQGQQITQTVKTAIHKHSDEIDPFYRVILQQFPSISESLQTDDDKASEDSEKPDQQTQDESKSDSDQAKTNDKDKVSDKQIQQQAKIVEAVVEELAKPDDNSDQQQTDTANASKNPGGNTAAHASSDAASGDENSDVKKSLKDLNLNYPMLGRIVMRIFNVGVGAVGSAFNLASYLVLLLVIISFCFFFFSWKLGPILEWFKPLIPMDVRERTLHILSEIDKSTNAFIRGRLIQSLVMSVVLSIGWMFAGVPSWLLLGIICGFLNLIPYAASLGFLAALGLTLISATGDDTAFTWGLLIWPTVVYGVAQLADGWVVEPLVQGKATNLDPLTVMLAVIIGGALMGLLGMLLAIPLASSIKILGREWIVPELKAYAESRKPDKRENQEA
ncbi:MAG: AI-2E family transporter [Phycisphaeraceae bacterium JB051]